MKGDQWEYGSKRGSEIKKNVRSKGKPSKAKQSNFYLLTQAGYVAAIQMMQACGYTACALGITSEYSFTDLGWIDS